MQNRDADAHFESKPHCGNWQKKNLTHNQRTNLHEWSNIVRPKKGHKHASLRQPNMDYTSVILRMEKI